MSKFNFRGRFKLDRLKLYRFKLERFKLDSETSKESGFSLLEVLLILFLLGIILRMVSLHYDSSIENVRQKEDEANIKLIEGAVQLYRIDTGHFPVSIESLIEEPSDVSGWRGPYLQQWPVDPWNSTKSYQIDARGNVQ